ncbi:11951_t:CDS:2 [Entrophospora sp. SA101]|nr:11951_t:CDS:2 [Entrophospora sp. SA101]
MSSNNSTGTSDKSDIENVLKDLSNGLIKNPNQPLFKVIFKNLESWPFLPNSLQQQHTTRIAILDSSFNPPTNAHLALLKNSIINIYNDKSQQQFFHGSLLLYSINNPDKILSSSDAKPIDRLIMMKILASYIINSPKSINNPALQNIAVGELSEFFMKNYIICANREGYDNDEIENFFNSEIVKEITNNNNNNDEKKILTIILNDEISKISSTKVRELIKNQSNKEPLPRDKFNELLYGLSPKPIINYYIQQNQAMLQEVPEGKI